MRRADVGELVGLAALWGGSYLFMRMAAPAFGAIALSEVRVGVASLVLLPLLFARGLGPALRRHWRAVAVVGLLNSALPFMFYSYAALSITAGLASIFNATTPLWTALIAWLWLRDALTPSRVLGFAIGFAGVLWLAWEKASFKDGGSGMAVLACIAATLCYAVSANATKRYLTGVPPLAVAAGSQVSSALLLALPALWAWPAEPPAAIDWWAAVLLGTVCTGVAYILFFRLIAHVGPANAISVTYLIPVFAVLWGYLFLGETVTPVMVGGSLVILAGTALATGLLTLPLLEQRRSRRPAD